jgi:hypothetical protein
MSFRLIREILDFKRLYVILMARPEESLRLIRHSVAGFDDDTSFRIPMGRGILKFSQSPDKSGFFEMTETLYCHSVRRDELFRNL